jgi:hypothetical protein
MLLGENVGKSVDGRELFGRVFSTPPPPPKYLSRHLLFHVTWGEGHRPEVPFSLHVLKYSNVSRLRISPFEFQAEYSYLSRTSSLENTPSKHEIAPK